MGGTSPASWRRGASAAAYFVALAGVVSLLLMLLLYCLCYMLNKVKEVTKSECPSSSVQPATKLPNYPLTKESRSGACAVRLYGSMPTASETPSSAPCSTITNTQ